MSKDYQLAFDRYKLAALELSLGGGFLDDEERYRSSVSAIDGAREECDTALSAYLTHVRSHEAKPTNVIVMPSLESCG